MVIKRHIQPALMQSATNYPVIALCGPRQSGKTTLAKMTFPEHSYVNLKDSFTFKFATENPVAFFKKYKPPVIIDEMQQVPEILNHVQNAANEQKRNGSFILIDSNLQTLMESFAGKAKTFHVLPLSFAELSSAGINMARDEYIHSGFMPGLYASKMRPNEFYENYFEIHIERRARFNLFVKLLAGRIGQILNLNSMSSDVGVSSTTLASWLSKLEVNHIVFKLPSYFNNFGKRIIKAPKIYFTEVGLAAWLLGIESSEQVFRDPLLDILFENMVIADVLKFRYNHGAEPQLYYFRDQHGLEIDLLINHRNYLQPMEIKATKTYDSSLAKNIHSFSAFASNIDKSMVVYAGKSNIKSKGITTVNFAKSGIRAVPGAKAPIEPIEELVTLP